MECGRGKNKDGSRRRRDLAEGCVQAQGTEAQGGYFAIRIPAVAARSQEAAGHVRRAHFPRALGALHIGKWLYDRRIFGGRFSMTLVSTRAPDNQDVPARATLLSSGPRTIRYQCLCGREQSTAKSDWARVDRECHCEMTPRRFPRVSLMGHVYGRLTVVGWLGRRPNGFHHYWKVLCECGNTRDIAGCDLRRTRHPTHSCGCLVVEWVRSEARKQILMHDLTGQRFGRLVALEQLPARGACRNYWWRCLCECGNTTAKIGTALTGGKAASCGCWPYEPKAQDISGKRFGHLTAKMKVADADSMIMERWKCRCSCGSTRTLYRYQLFSQDPEQSCGCVPRKAAEPPARTPKVADRD